MNGPVKRRKMSFPGQYRLGAEHTTVYRIIQNSHYYQCSHYLKVNVY